MAYDCLMVNGCIDTIVNMRIGTRIHNRFTTPNHCFSQPVSNQQRTLTSRQH